MLRTTRRFSLAGFLLMATLPIVAQQAKGSGWPPSADHAVINLWPKTAPDADPVSGEKPGDEKDLTTDKDALIAGRPLMHLSNVSVPTLTVYKPQGKNTGAAVVVFPGGGYRILAIDLEGSEVCDWLTARGLTCFVLKYRVPGPGPYPKSKAALDDAQRAVGIVREHAVEFGIDPKRVGVLGFSAGAHLAAALGTHFQSRLYPAVDAADALSCRPDFAVIVYPGYLALEEKSMAFHPDVPVTSENPTTFVLQAENDPVHVENAVSYFMELKKAGVPAELHIYAEGGHGFGLRRTEKPVTAWPDLVDVWMKTIHMVAAN